MENWYVQVKYAETDEVVKQLGPMTERKATQVANGMDINMSDEYYTEVVQIEIKEPS